MKKNIVTKTPRVQNKQKKSTSMDSSPREWPSPPGDNTRAALRRPSRKKRRKVDALPAVVVVRPPVRCSDADAIDKIGQLVRNIGNSHINNAIDKDAMTKLGLAVVKHGRNSKQVIALEEAGMLPRKRAALDFLSRTYGVYAEALEKYRMIAGLETCCVCLGAVDDTAIREINGDSSRRFVSFDNIPSNPNEGGAVKCSCKHKPICLTCFLQMIQTSPNEGCVRVQCPTCRRDYDFEVGMRYDHFGQRVMRVDHHAMARAPPGARVPFSIYSPPPPIPHPQLQRHRHRHLPELSGQEITNMLEQIEASMGPVFSESESEGQQVEVADRMSMSDREIIDASHEQFATVLRGALRVTEILDE